MASVEKEKLTRIDEIFDDLRREGKTSEEIFAAVYQPLKRLAHRMLTGKPVSDSMHATRLVSDVYFKLYGKLASDCEWDSGVHFFRTMAVAMQNLLIDYLRKKRRDTVASANEINEEIEGSVLNPRNLNLPQERSEQLMICNEAITTESVLLMRYLSWLKEDKEGSEFIQKSGLIIDERKLKIAVALMWLVEDSETDERKRDVARRQAEVMRLRELSGMTVDEVAKLLNTSPRTVKNDYVHAKGKLLHFIETASG